MKSGPRVREAAVAGSFYPGDETTLRRTVEGFLADARVPELTGRPVALVAPHAGYVYSGRTAAYSYRCLKNRGIHTAVVISPSHMEHFPFASVFCGDSYETPLGAVEVDRKLAARIARGGSVRCSQRGHIQPGSAGGEHALEVQLPFLQCVAGKCRIVPIVMGDQSWDLCVALGQALAPFLGRPGVVAVASSDLSHFYADDIARRKDALFCEMLESFDPAALHDAVRKNTCEACGAGPVVAALIASRTVGATRCVVLSQANSGEVTGDRDCVVGYAAAVVIDEHADVS